MARKNDRVVVGDRGCEFTLLLNYAGLSGCVMFTQVGEGKTISLKNGAFPEDSLQTHRDTLFSSDWLSIFPDIADYELTCHPSSGTLFFFFFNVLFLLEKASLHLYTNRKYFKPFDF